MYPAGTIIETWEVLYWHRGVALGNGYVLHNTPGVGEQIIPESVFIGNSKFKTRQPVSFDLGGFEARVRQAHTQPRNYSWLTWNCDHTVSWALTGRAESPQLQGYATFAVCTIALSALARA